MYCASLYIVSGYKLRYLTVRQQKIQPASVMVGSGRIGRD